MGMFGGIREGTWWIHSKTDERWRMEGRAIGSAFCCPAADQALKELKAKYGEPPDDCEIGFMKD